jgi:plasmid maintenance system antidote protein VapI
MQENLALRKLSACVTVSGVGQEIHCPAQRKDHPMQESSSPGAFGDLLRQRGLTYEAAAVLAQVETSTISRIARGQSRARPQTIVTLARALGISPKRLEAMTGSAWDAAHPDEQVPA